MKINKKIINIARQHPNISSLGYNMLKKYWSVKANFTDYNFPKDKATINKELAVEFNKNRPYGPKKKICYAPFNNLHFQINGNVSACSFNYDFIIGNVNENTIKEIWAGKKAQVFREKLGNYNFELCKSCEHVLTAKNFNSFPPLKYDMYADDDINYPNQMSFEMSDLCNYECVMCSENFSSLIRKRKGFTPQKFSYPERFFTELQEFLPHLKMTTFIGGEPLLIKAYFRIWEDILKVNNKCTIHIQTNASYLPPRFLEMLESGQFDVGISLDATEKETFEKIRINSNFEEVIENINILKSYMDRNKVNLNLNFCPLTQNWQEIPKIIHYANNLNIPLKIVNVENPRNLSLQHRNASYLTQIISYLEINTNFNPNGIIQEKNVQSYKQYIGQLKYLQKAAIEREKYFSENYLKISEKFRELFKTSNLFNNFNIEQRNELQNNIISYIDELISENKQLKNRTIFRVYYALFRFKHTNNGDASTNFEYGQNILKGVIKEFYLLEKEEFNN